MGSGLHPLSLPALPRPLSHRTSGSRGKIYSCRSLYFSLCNSPCAGKQRDRSPREASTFPETWQASFPLSGSPSAPPEGNNADICLQMPYVGPCRALLPRYYYDRFTQSCRQFFYGGCEGNANNFRTLEDCDEACGRIESPSFCYSPKDGGECSGNVTRYYFNPRHKACEAFTYTGCGGNDNNFDNIEDCTRVCLKAVKKEKNEKIPDTILPMEDN